MNPCPLSPIAAPVQFQTAPVYSNLFDGRTLRGWRATGNASIWTVKDGAIVGINDEKKSSSIFFTKTKYEDFDRPLKVMWTGIADSGVFLRKPELQVQFGQSNSLKVDMTCCFYTGTKGDIYPQAGRGKGVTTHLKEGQLNTLRAVPAATASRSGSMALRPPTTLTPPSQFRPPLSIATL